MVFRSKSGKIKLRTSIDYLFVISSLFPGCSSPTPPEIHIDVSPVNVGVRSTSPDVSPLHFDMQLYNRGEELLEIDGVKIHGDRNCSFSFEGPDRYQLEQDDSAFIRGWYQPTVEGEDQLAMEVRSNSHVDALLVVPICGKGVAPDAEGATPAECVVPEESQGECESGAYEAP